MNSNEFYFTTYLTENEHYIVEGIITGICEAHDWELVYYRKFKEGHQLCYRECKIRGNVGLIRKSLKEAGIKISNANEKVSVYGRKVRKFLADELTIATCKVNLNPK